VGDRTRGGGQLPAHAALFYGTQEEYLTGAVGFVNAGLAEGGAVLVGAPEPGMSLLRDRMGHRAGLVSWADMRRVGANPARIIAWMRDFAAAHGGRPVRFLQEAVWAARTAPEHCEVIRHEALVNIAFAAAPVSVLCPYDTAQLDAGVIKSAMPTHPLLIRGGGAVPSHAYDAGAAVPAECDQPLPRPPDGAAVLSYRADLSAVRAFAARHAREAGLAPARVDDLVLAVGELAANTLRHSHDSGVIAVWASEGELLCQIEDAGHISDPLAGRWKAATDAGGGHGLWLVHQVCDLVEIRTSPGRTEIRLHLGLVTEPGRGRS
jgi:anti-sigma regulatory factor (Ser/Thr protein kinase)